MDGVAGAGIFYKLFSQYLSLGMAKTTLDGEVETIKVSLVKLDARSSLFNPTVFFSDSQAAILAIANYSSPLLYVCDVAYICNKRDAQKI